MVVPALWYCCQLCTCCSTCCCFRGHTGPERRIKALGKVATGKFKLLRCFSALLWVQQKQQKLSPLLLCQAWFGSLCCGWSVTFGLQTRQRQNKDVCCEQDKWTGRATAQQTFEELAGKQSFHAPRPCRTKAHCSLYCSANNVKHLMQAFARTG